MPEFLKHIDKKRILHHSIFWTCWIFGFAFIQSFGFGINDFAAWLIYSMVTLPLFMAHTYLIAYWLVPGYFLKYRFWLFLAWIVVFLIIFSVFELVISNELIWMLVKPENKQSVADYSWQNILINGLKNEYIVFVFLAVKVIRFWNSKMGEKADLLNRQLSTEIELLKIQSYPKFVLNVIEKLEVLAQMHSPQTPEMIIRLSNLLNHMAYGKISNKISLLKEVELIRSYIDIQKMSFPAGIDVKFMVLGELKGLRIPPFLFFHLVEEGFILFDDFTIKSDFTIRIQSGSDSLSFSMILLNDQVLKKQFSSEVLENCRKSLQYFYPHNYQIISNFEINFVEIAIEIYS